MRAQRLPVLLWLGLSVAAFPIGSRVASAQVPEVQSNATGSASLASIYAGSEAARLSNGTADTLTAIKQGKSESIRIESDLMAFQEMLQRHRTAGNVEGQAQAFAAIASSYRALKQEQRAIDNFQSAYVAWHQLGRSRDEATTIAHIGDVYREWGFPDRAVDFYGKALKMYSRISYTQGEAATQNNIGVAYLTLNEKNRCLKYFHQALDLYSSDHNRHGEASTLSNIAAAHMFFLARDPEKALDELQRVLGRLEPLDDPASEANVLEMMGIAQLQLNRKEMAKGSFQRALALYQAVGDTQGESAATRHIKRLESSGPYHVHQIDAVGIATLDPLGLTVAQLRVFDRLAVE